MKNDTIYRQAGIDALFELYEYQRNIDPTEAADLVRQGIYLAEKKIEQLPSAQRHGRWIIDKNFSNIGRCSFCGDRWGSVDQMNYCPSCGARMDLEEE